MKEKPPPGAGSVRRAENTAGTRGFIAPAVVVMCLPLEKGHLHVSVQKTRAGDLSNAGANREVTQSVALHAGVSPGFEGSEQRHFFSFLRRF